MTALFRMFGAPAILLGKVVRAIGRDGLSSQATMRQLVHMGAKSSFLIVTGLAFFGAVMVTIAWAQARKYTGNVSVLGPAYFELMLREFTPLLVAVLAASRIGAGTSAEIAAMSVNEQLEALELSAADPISELVAPRWVASMIAMPLLFTVGTAAAALSARFVVTFAFGADGGAFTDARFVDGADIVCALVKALVCGSFIPLAAAGKGLIAKNGAGAVGEAVTNAVVEAAMGCLLIDFVVAAGFLLLGV